MSEAKISCPKRTVEKTEADRMFEKLGYNLEIYEKEYKDTDWVGGKLVDVCHYEPIMAYCDRKTPIGDIHYRFEFLLEKKTFIKEARFYNFDEIHSEAITMEELKAINKKAEELGWI